MLQWLSDSLNSLNLLGKLMKSSLWTIRNHTISLHAYLQFYNWAFVFYSSDFYSNDYFNYSRKVVQHVRLVFFCLFGGSCRVTIVVAPAFCPKILVGTYEWYFVILSMQVEWWGQSNPSCCNQICVTGATLFAFHLVVLL